MDYEIDRVVIHVVQGSYATALDVFRDPDHEAAAHYVVRKDGHIAQMIRELDVAFHAGNRGYNERSVGIEHEGYVDRPESFTEAMYASSARLTAAICRMGTASLPTGSTSWGTWRCRERITRIRGGTGTGAGIWGSYAPSCASPYPSP